MRYQLGTNTMYVQCQRGETFATINGLIAALNAAGHTCRITGSGTTRLAKHDYVELTFQTRAAAAAAEEWIKDNLGTR